MLYLWHKQHISCLRAFRESLEIQELNPTSNSLPPQFVSSQLNHVKVVKLDVALKALKHLLPGSAESTRIHSSFCPERSSFVLSVFIQIFSATLLFTPFKPSVNAVVSIAPQVRARGAVHRFEEVHWRPEHLPYPAWRAQVSNRGHHVHRWGSAGRERLWSSEFFCHLLISRHPPSN